MKNRYGDEYSFELVSEGVYTIVGDLKYWRYGGLEGQERISMDELGFVDPSGGPFISVGGKLPGMNESVKRIRVDKENDRILFEVE